MVEEFVSRMFALRDASHVAHWASKSYAEHQALGSFYDDIIDKVDAIIEAYQGVNDLVGNIPAPDSKGGDILSLLQDDAEWIEAHHEDICGGNRAIANLIDGLTDKYLSTIYKLRFLK